MKKFTILALAGFVFTLLVASAGAAPAPQDATTSLASYHSEAAQLCVDPAAAALDVQMGDCCRVNVKGCGDKAQICVPGDCNSDAKKAARASFEDKYSCKGHSVSGYTGDRCSSKKCDWAL